MTTNKPKTQKEKWVKPQGKRSKTMSKMVNHQPPMVNQEHLNAMVKALRKVENSKGKVFTIKRDNSAGTVIVTHPKVGEVFRAIQTDRKSKMWLVREIPNLWQPKV